MKKIKFLKNLKIICLSICIFGTSLAMKEEPCHNTNITTNTLKEYIIHLLQDKQFFLQEIENDINSFGSSLLSHPKDLIMQHFIFYIITVNLLNNSTPDNCIFLKKVFLDLFAEINKTQNFSTIQGSIMLKLSLILKNLVKHNFIGENFEHLKNHGQNLFKRLTNFIAPSTVIFICQKYLNSLNIEKRIEAIQKILSTPPHLNLSADTEFEKFLKSLFLKTIINNVLIKP